MRISLRAGEKFYLNGAIITADRKVSLQLLNDADFLLEAHVISAEEASTPLRQLYFSIQIALMEPASAQSRTRSILQKFAWTNECFSDPEITASLQKARLSFENNRYFEALKILRVLFAQEQNVLASGLTCPANARRSA